MSNRVELADCAGDPDPNEPPGKLISAKIFLGRLVRAFAEGDLLMLLRDSMDLAASELAHDITDPVLIIPMGDPDLEDVIFCYNVVRDILHMQCRVAKKREPIKKLYVPDSDVLLAERMLEYGYWQLKKSKLGKFARVLVLTGNEMKSLELPWVYGYGHLKQRVCTISTAKISADNPSQAVRQARLFKIVVHELGHTFGLQHCESRMCVMKTIGDSADLDYQDPWFCAECRVKATRVLSTKNHSYPHELVRESDGIVLEPTVAVECSGSR